MIRTTLPIAFAVMLLLAWLPASAQSPARLDLQLSTGISADGAATPGAPAAQNHRIEAGDSVSVTVYREPDLSLQGQRVRSDGTIAMPLLGDLQVGGLTSKQLQQLITERLADGYLKKPNVTVIVEQHRLYYIKGEVENPGGYAFVDGLTVEQAIAVAGGYTERASRSKFTVVREKRPGKPISGLSLSTRVMPGDVITVEESFF